MKTTLAEWDARCAPFTIKIDAVVYLLEDGETREEINTLLLGRNGFLKSRQPSGPPRPLRTACPPATGAGPLARQSRRRCRLFGVRAGAPGDSVSRRGDQYSWRYRRPWLTILSQDEYFKNLSPSSSSFSSSRRYFLRREPIGGGGEGLLSNILHLDSRIRVHFLGRPY